MFPCPVSRHKVAVLSLLVTEFLVRHVVNVSLEIWTCEDVLDHFMRIPMPDVILRRLPLCRVGRFRERPLISKASIFPTDVAEFDRIDLPVKVFVVSDGWRVVMRNECGSPEFEELIDLAQ